VTRVFFDLDVWGQASRIHMSEQLFAFISGRGRRVGSVGEDFGEIFRFAAGGGAGVARNKAARTPLPR
jgi:hypothetical protein